MKNKLNMTSDHYHITLNISSL